MGEVFLHRRKRSRPQPVGRPEAAPYSAPRRHFLRRGRPLDAPHLPGQSGADLRANLPIVVLSAAPAESKDPFPPRPGWMIQPVP